MNLSLNIEDLKYYTWIIVLLLILAYNIYLYIVIKIMKIK